MARVKERVEVWLRRPQRTRGDDLRVALVAAALLWVLGYVAGRLLDAIGLIDFTNVVPIWLAALGGGVMLLVGLLLGRRAAGRRPETRQLYTEHLRDALEDLRRLTAGELPSFQIRDYVENGLFQPAFRLLTRGRDRGDVRFSILHPDDDDPAVLTMQGSEGLYPALGHSMEARQEFRIPIDDSFSGLTYRTGRLHDSNRLSEDERWRPHPRARPGREYESIVSVPLIWRGNTDGVLNVVATEPDAFDSADQTYIALLGSVIDVARSIGGQWG